MDKAKLLKAVEEAFLPAREIEVPKLFSGRGAEIVQGLYTLRSQGASLCIYGPRGVGKTSFAKQLKLLASGYSVLADLIGRPDLFDSELFNFPNVYFQCDSTIQNTDDLFRKLLSDRDSFNGICRYNGGVILRKIKEKRTYRGELALKILGASESTEEEIERVVVKPDPVAAFKSVTSEVVDSAGSGAMIVVIDDFELLSDKSAIASIIRSCPHVKFMLIGVAEDMKALVADHESIKRQFAEGKIKVPPMTEEMLAGILRRAEKLLQEVNKDINFEEAVSTKIISLANGYPHWVHLMGKYSSIDAIEQSNTVIRMDNFQKGLERIVKNEPEYEDLYLKVASEFREKEMVLKLLAFEKSEVQNLRDIYARLEKLGLEMATSDKYVETFLAEGILHRVREGFCRFNEPRFKGFVGIREPLYRGNTKEELLQEREDLTVVWKASEALVAETQISFYDLYSSYYYVKDNLGTSIELNEDHWNSLIYCEEKPLLYNDKGQPIKKSSRKPLTVTLRRTNKK